MKFIPSLREVRAAHALSAALADGRRPDVKSLDHLGLPRSLAKNFQR